MKYILKTKVWLEKDGRRIFGDGPWDILLRVQRTGSLSRASEEIGMSYSQAWQLLNNLEKELGYSLLHRKAGGEGGGGSVLTKKGAELVQKFGSFRRELKLLQEKLYQKYFPGDGGI